MLFFNKTKMKSKLISFRYQNYQFEIFCRYFACIILVLYEPVTAFLFKNVVKIT